MHADGSRVHKDSIILNSTFKPSSASDTGAGELSACLLENDY